MHSIGVLIKDSGVKPPAPPSPTRYPRWEKENSPRDQPVGKIADGLAVDRGPVPLAHRFEIRGALIVRRAGLEAGKLQQVRGGGEHIGHAVPEIDMAVAVEIDAVLDVGRRQELRLTDLAGEGADQVALRKIAALDDLQRRQQFALEQI